MRRLTLPLTLPLPYPYPYPCPYPYPYPTQVCDVFRCRCALTGVRYDSPDRPGFQLCRWDPARAPTLDNVLFATTAAAERHEQLGPQALQPEPSPAPEP